MLKSDSVILNTPLLNVCPSIKWIYISMIALFDISNFEEFISRFRLSFGCLSPQSERDSLFKFFFQ